MGYVTTKERYRKHRLHARELLEEELLQEFRRRIKVVAIDDDVLREARREWYDHPNRLVAWDWDTGVAAPGRRSSARFFDFALIDKGALCVLVAARVSHKKRWLSLTHVESAPGEHSLRGQVIPLAIKALYIYRALICGEEAAETIGIRILNPIPDAVQCYAGHGYTRNDFTKWHRAINVEMPLAPAARGPEHGRETQGSAVTSAENGADGDR